MHAWQCRYLTLQLDIMQVTESHTSPKVMQCQIYALHIPLGHKYTGEY